MPYSSVSEAEKKIPSIKNLSGSQKREFLRVFNAMLREDPNMPESSAIRIAISQAKRVKKSMDIDLDDLNLSDEEMEVIEQIQKQRLKTIGSGQKLPASQFAYVGDPERTETWKFPINDKEHVQNAVARLNQTDLTGSAKAEAKRKIRSAYRRYFPDNDLPEVLKSFEEVEEASVLKRLVYKFLDYFPIVPESESKDEITNICKAMNEEKRTALFVVLPVDEFDLHGDIYSADEVEKACINFNTHCMVANLFHRVETEKAVIQQSFINPADFETEDGRLVKKGVWLQWWHFPEGDDESDVLWEGVKKGKFNGVSIQCRADVEELE